MDHMKEGIGLRGLRPARPPDRVQARGLRPLRGDGRPRADLGHRAPLQDAGRPRRGPRARAPPGRRRAAAPGVRRPASCSRAARPSAGPRRRGAGRRSAGTIPARAAPARSTRSAVSPRGREGSSLRRLSPAGRPPGPGSPHQHVGCRDRRSVHPWYFFLGQPPGPCYQSVTVMRLQGVTLFGFKSFADRTDVRILPGITAIVGPERLRQVEHLGRAPVGARRAEPQGAPRPPDGGRDLPRVGLAAAARAVRGPADVLERRRAVRAVERGRPRPAALPRRRVRVPPQQDGLPAEGHPRPLPGHGREPEGLRAHGAGAPGPDPHREAARPAGLRGGGGGHHPVQAPAGRDARQAGGDAPEPPPRAGRDGRGQAAARPRSSARRRRRSSTRRSRPSGGRSRWPSWRRSTRR